MLRAFHLASVQIVTDSRLRRLALLSVLLAAILGIAGIVAGIALQDMALGLSEGWLATAANWLTGLALALLLWMLFPSLVLLVMSFFLEGAIAAVERRHYPHLPPAKGLSRAETLRGVAGSLFVLIGLNFLLLPLYIALWLFPPLAFLCGALINGYFLGREYFEMVAWRRLGLAEAGRLWRSKRSIWYGAGLIIGLISLIPFVNLVAPIMAAAFMSHLVIATLPEDPLPPFAA